MIRVALLSIALLVPAAAVAGEPAFQKAEEVKEGKGVEWTAQAQAGLISTTGNSKTTTLSAAARGSRKEGNNKVRAEAGVAYARSTLYAPNDLNMNNTIDSEAEIAEIEKTTTEAWMATVRYDRYLTAHNSLYAVGIASSDKPAGKELVAGGQVGYSRELFKNDKHLVVGEVGYDISYEDPVVGDGVAIHSARGFVGYEGKLTADTSVGGSVETLINVNTLDGPAGKIDRFEDTRINGLTKLSTKLYENINFGFSFGIKFDNAPSARPPVGLDYGPGFVPLADKVDTRTEVSLLVNFI